jgi:SAM-dependent methyltransferase
LKTTNQVTASEEYARDRELTLRNRSRLTSNRNLLYWYEQLYREQFRGLGDISGLRVLEIGSGVSPLARFYPTVETSDVLDLDYLDHVFDCHEIEQLDRVADASLDIITLTNVLHHLQRPIDFLHGAAKKLKPGGLVIATEPYFSWISTLIYRHLHHEPVDFGIETPELAEVRGPLSSANEALPWLIFTRPGWRRKIEEDYEFERDPFRPFTALAYFATGGISRRLGIPHALYRILFALDLFWSRLFPMMSAAFFTIRLRRR